MALQIPSTLRLAQLRTLAYKCGISSSGTKPILSSRLYDEITSTPRHSQPGTRILSIDMGIRNLAYCILDLPSVRSKKLPSILAWHRLAVSSAPKQSGDIDTPTAKEVFDPPTLSKAAYGLLRHRLLLLKPTHVLIERQRFRSNGSRHILEWTIRVNLLESILYAVLCTLKEDGVWKGEVKAITPGKVGPFWVGEEDTKTEGKKRTSQSAKIKNKGAKIDLVRKWLVGKEMVGLGSEEVEAMVKAYIEKWEKLPGAPTGKRKIKGDTEPVEEKMGKLDDLADCLLQGMAWVQWEENKRLVLKEGVEALLEDVE